MSDVFVNNVSRNDAAFVAARHHSQRVKFFKNALPLLALAIAFAFSWVTFFATHPSADIVMLNSETGVNNKLVMLQPRIEGYSKTNQPYMLKSARAVQDQTRDGMIDLEEIDASMPLGGRGFAHILAQSGIFDNINGRIILDKPFQIETSDGILARFLSADVNIESSQLISNEPVTIERQGEILTAQRARILEGGAIFLFENGIRLMIAAK